MTPAPRRSAPSSKTACSQCTWPRTIRPRPTRHPRQAARLIHGPALHAEARDNTLEAALLKATQDLEHQVQAAQVRRMERGKSKLQLSAISGRWTHAQAGRRA